MSHTERRSRKQQQQQQQQQEVESSNDSNTGEDQETPVDHLSRNNTTTLIKDAVRVLLANRPDDPLQFLVDFFAPRVSKSIEIAYDKLSWTHYLMPVYQRNVLEVYDTLVLMKNDDSHLMGLLGSRFNELLFKLIVDLPANYTDMVYERVKTRDDLVVSFNRFYHNILLLHVLKDFISLVNAIHTDLDAQEVGKVSQKLCMLVVDRLFVSFSQTDVSISSFDKTFSQIFLANADANRLDEKNSMNQNEFVKTCIGRLLDHTI